MALQSFVGPWPVFQFYNPIYSQQDSLGGGSARRKAATYTHNSTNTEYNNKDTHASSGTRTHDPSVTESEDSSCVIPRGHCDRNSYNMTRFNGNQSRHTGDVVDH
jgi:hypothetical protein